jgi:hypothetical protein
MLDIFCADFYSLIKADQLSGRKEKITESDKILPPLRYPYTSNLNGTIHLPHGRSYVRTKGVLSQ